MTFSRTEDWDLVKEIFTDPAIYPHISDDCCPAPEHWEPNKHESIWYVLVKDGAEIMGMFMLVPLNAACFEVHTCLLPCSWGARARRISRELAKWVWANVPCLRVITNVPECNRLALRFAECAGLKKFGVNEMSYLKNGVLYNQIMLGISKPEEA